MICMWYKQVLLKEYWSVLKHGNIVNGVIDEPEFKKNVTKLNIIMWAVLWQVTGCPCCRYIRLFGYNFSKSDHICLVHLVFDLMTIPNLELSLVQKYAALLTTLIKYVFHISSCLMDPSFLSYKTIWNR